MFVDTFTLSFISLLSLPTVAVCILKVGLPNVIRFGIIGTTLVIGVASNDDDEDRRQNGILGSLLLDSAY